MRQSTTRHRCPHCDTMLHSVEKLAGRSMDCPNCDGKLTVPAPRTLVPVPRPAAVAEVIDDDFEDELDDGDKPAEIQLGKLIRMKADVDKPTRNSMALVTTGGILVALGAIIVWIFGGKSKPS